MGGLLDPKMNLPKIEPTKMADQEDPAVKDAGRRKRRQEEERTGRASTNLSGGGVPDTYAGSQLGS